MPFSSSKVITPAVKNLTESTVYAVIKPQLDGKNYGERKHIHISSDNIIVF